MSMSAAAIYTCDRDGTVSASVPGWPNTMAVPLPDGWTRFNVDQSQGGGAVISHVGHLCPACAAAFVIFLQDAGGGAMFNPP
jgi:hypothetical protein